MRLSAKGSSILLLLPFAVFNTISAYKMRFFYQSFKMIGAEGWRLLRESTKRKTQQTARSEGCGFRMCPRKAGNQH